MLGFLRRIPELLGLKRSTGAKPAAKPSGSVGAPGAKAQSGEAKPTPRGRGAGRGLTPPRPAGPKKNHRKSGGKK